MVRIIIKKSNFLLLLVMISFILAISLIMSFNFNYITTPKTPQEHGHSPDEIIVNINGQVKPLQQAIDDGDFVVHSGGIEKIEGTEWTSLLDTSTSLDVDFGSNCAADTNPIIIDVFWTPSSYSAVSYRVDGYCVE